VGVAPWNSYVRLFAAAGLDPIDLEDVERLREWASQH
jgi:hypothetical protein